MIETMKRISLALFLLTITGCATLLDEDGAVAVAPYHLRDAGRIVIEVNVNNQGPYEFALDTAASISVVFDSLAKTLDLKPIPGKRVLIHGAVNSEPAPLINVDTIAVGNSRWVNPRIALISNAHAGEGLDGILGMDFMRQYAVGFSRADRVVRLYPPELISKRSYRGWNNIPLTTDAVRDSNAVLYVMKLQIKNRNVKAVLDLGAGVNIMNWDAAQKLGVAKLKPAHGVVMSGANDTTPVTARVRTESMSTGSIRWRAEEFAIADLDIFSVLELDTEPAVILGAGLFTQRDFVIDFVRNRMLVSNDIDKR